MIFIRLSGGLGNQLFQLAAALHLQAKTNMPISFYTSHLKNYETPREFMLKEILPKEFKFQVLKPSLFVQTILKYRINKAIPFLFNWSITNRNLSSPKTSRFYVLDDYFQDITLFKNELSIVSSFIVESAKNNEKVNNFIFSKNQLKNSVALHIRRGDFLSKSNASIYYIQQINYYKNAIATLSGIEKIYLFSETSIDDFENIKNLQFEIIERTILSDLDQFLLMSKFPNLVIANSTYSFWAGIAAKSGNQNAVIIAPERWYYSEKINNLWIKNLTKTGFNITQ